MFTLFSGRNVGGLKRSSTEHGGSILGSVILCVTFRRIPQLADDAHTLNFKNCHLYLSSTMSLFFLLYPMYSFDVIFYCVSMYTLYIIKAKIRETDLRTSQTEAIKLLFKE